MKIFLLFFVISFTFASHSMEQYVRMKLKDQDQNSDELVEKNETIDTTNELYLRISALKAMLPIKQHKIASQLNMNIPEKNKATELVEHKEDQAVVSEQNPTKNASRLHCSIV